MIAAVCFVIAAAFGASARAFIGRLTNEPNGIAYGTFTVNVVGSFALGALQNVSPVVVTVAGVGFLGSLTTFSSLARETVVLVELRKSLLAAGYLGLSLVVSVGAAALGLWCS